MGRKGGAGLENKIRELRARHRLTQADLAKRVDVSRQTIIAIENGNYNPSIVLAFRIADILQEPVTDVFWLNGIEQSSDSTGDSS